jgi:hypothetical protein
MEISGNNGFLSEKKHKIITIKASKRQQWQLREQP